MVDYTVPSVIDPITPDRTVMRSSDTHLDGKGPNREEEINHGSVQPEAQHCQRRLPSRLLLQPMHSRHFQITDLLSMKPIIVGRVRNGVYHLERTRAGKAVKHARWRDAMAKEISALEANNTWTLMPLPYGKRAIDSKWVYKVKFHPDGTMERYKARLVAKGYTLIERLDFHETFAPVAKLVMVQGLLAIASIRK
ncbi:hypothetical protein RJ639_001357 [Escallonia herrerae]|uniref:Reverse transcriptase Ty1/copia-type domain-containing protein n=1 Tax=Escallonia herrerae TaxID=1293975 RepID=A0AA88X954_9ASTE|nr:hypothetical protein RJ639_001357 [Escallonia herrerae]